MCVAGGEDRIALDSELQREISIVWPYLPQKNLDLLVPINKGLSLSRDTGCHAGRRAATVNVALCPHRHGHDGGEDLRLHDDNGLLQTQQGQETTATT